MNRLNALQAHAGSLPAFAKVVYFLFKTFSCKAQIAAVIISIYGISNMNFQHIRTSLCTTGFGFPLPPPLPSSVVAEVQTRSVTSRITWSGRAEAGLKHTHSLVCHPLHACSPLVGQGFTTHSSDSALSSSSTKVMASESQEEIKQRDLL